MEHRVFASVSRLSRAVAAPLRRSVESALANEPPLAVGHHSRFSLMRWLLRRWVVGVRVLTPTAASAMRKVSTLGGAGFLNVMRPDPGAWSGRDGQRHSL